jgi:phosphate-selective porin OprO and OprP
MEAVETMHPLNLSPPGLALRRALAAIPTALAAALVLALTAGAAAAQEPPMQPPAETVPPEAAAADEAPPEPTIQEQIEQLRQQLLILQRNAELAAEAAAERAKSGATVTASARHGFSLESDDGNFTLRLRGYVQADGRFYGDDDAERDTFTLRRVRPTLEGTIHERFGFRVMPDFGGGATALQDAYVDWTFSAAAVLRAGKMKSPFGLERLQSGTDVTFVERALPTGLAPNRDLGVQLSGAIVGGRLEYAVGVFDGVPDGGSGDGDTNDEKDVVARLWASPWRGTPSPLAGLSFGIAASHGDQQGTVAAPGLAAYRTPGQLSFFSYRTDTPATAAGTAIADGDRFRLGPQAVYFNGPFGLIAEHTTSRHEVRRGILTAELGNTSWQATGVWVLSGEPLSLRWFTPARGFDRDEDDPEERGRGGFALAARYHAFSADPDSFPTFAASGATQQARAWAVGLDWTLQRQTRLLFDYEVTEFDGRGAPRQDEKVLFTRLQIGW